jgi:hypothetical protein
MWRAQRWSQTHGAERGTGGVHFSGLARVDFLVDRAGEPKFMELELIEPDLFLRYSPQSLKRLAELLLKRT